MTLTESEKNKLLTFVAYEGIPEIKHKFRDMDCSFVDLKGQNVLFPEVAKKRGLTYFFISRGANVNQQNIDGNTPLHLAAANVNVEALRILLDNGADVSIENKYGNQPLWTALMEANKVSSRPEGYELLELLLRNGSNRDHRNHSGISPRFFCLNNVTDKRIRSYFLDE